VRLFEKSGAVKTTQLTWRIASYYCNFNNGSLDAYIGVLCFMWQYVCTDESSWRMKTLMYLIKIIQREVMMENIAGY